MQKYQLDWRMKSVFWFLKRVPFTYTTNLRKIREGGQSSMPGFLFPHVPIAAVENRSIPGRQGQIPVRIYRPGTAGSLPVIIFFHGGGWVLGGLDSHDAICRRVAAENKALLVAVDYRLAPEHKFPAAVEDAYDATCWVAEHASQLGVDPGKLILMGDSAGGNLAAVVSQLSRDLTGPRIAFQVLIYPAVDLASDYPSKQMYTDMPVLDQQAVAYFKEQYIRQPADVRDPRISPLLADTLKNLPPALILTAEYDPLRDEGQAYANGLREAGNEVTHVCYPRMPHGFFSFGRLASQMDSAFAQIRQTLQPFSTE